MYDFWLEIMLKAIVVDGTSSIRFTLLLEPGHV